MLSIIRPKYIAGSSQDGQENRKYQPCAALMCKKLHSRASVWKGVENHVSERTQWVDARRASIEDDHIPKFAERALNLTAALDAKIAYSDADFVVIAVFERAGFDFRV